MGFNKRYVNSDRIIYWLENNLPLKQLFKADALIFEDSISSEVFDLLIKGVSDEKIKEKVKEKEKHAI